MHLYGQKINQLLPRRKYEHFNFQANMLIVQMSKTEKNMFCFLNRRFSMRHVRNDSDRNKLQTRFPNDRKFVAFFFGSFEKFGGICIRMCLRLFFYCCSQLKMGRNLIFGCVLLFLLLVFQAKSGTKNNNWTGLNDIKF